MSSSTARIHIGSRESIRRSGGMHNYIRGLSEGQSSIGHSVAVLDSVTGAGRYSVFTGTEPSMNEAGAGDALEIHFAYSGLPAMIRNKWMRAMDKKLIHFHGPWFAEGLAEKNSRTRAAIKWAVELSMYRFPGCRYVAASHSFADQLCGNFGIKRSSVSVVYPGVDTRRFFVGDKLEARRAIGISDSGFVFACVRRLEHRMGLHRAIDALRDVEDATLLVCGTGSLAEDLKTYATEAGVSARTKFLGRVSDEMLPLVYQAADATVVPTEALEGFGLIVLESFASGRPVVSTDSGGLREAQGPFAEEWTVPAGNTEALSSRMREVMRSGSEATCSAVRAYAESRSFENMAREIDEVIG